LWFRIAMGVMFMRGGGLGGNRDAEEEGGKQDGEFRFHHEFLGRE